MIENIDSIQLITEKRKYYMDRLYSYIKDGYDDFYLLRVCPQSVKVKNSDIIMQI